MSLTETVREGISAFERNDNATMARLLTDDFSFSGPMPQSLNKAQFLGLAQACLAAFPDWNFHTRDMREEGDKVLVTIEITGTQKGTLAAIPGVPPVPATGKAVHLPVERLTFTARGNQISAIQSDGAPGAGIPGLYAQVGAPVS